MADPKGLTISIKLYGRDGRKIAHEEVTLPPGVSDKDAEFIFKTLVDEAESGNHG